MYIYGFLITILISVPWYILELLKEGKPFWDNFFGYHNFQRYTSVVNNHAEPFWFFLYIMILASLPFTPFLYHGIFKTFKDFFKIQKYPSLSPNFTFNWTILFNVANKKISRYFKAITFKEYLKINFRYSRGKGNFSNDRDQKTFLTLLFETNSFL